MNSALDRIPVCEPALLGNEKKYVMEALETNWISSSGKFLGELEKSFAAYVGTKYAVAVSSGTAALHLALLALRIGPDDEVIIPNFTMISTAFAPCYVGARPVLVDVDPKTWCMRPEAVARAITAKTRAIIPVHIFGHACDMDPIMELAGKHDIAVVEDAAESHGSKYRGKMTGSIGRLNCFSLFANKLITCGEGGLITTDDEGLYQRCLKLKNLSFPVNGPRHYLHDEIGYNYRLTNLQAAVALGQLEQIDTFAANRRRNFELYRAAFADTPAVEMQGRESWCEWVPWMVGICVPSQELRDRVMTQLAAQGIETRRFFAPMHIQPSLAHFGFHEDDGAKHSVTMKLAATGFYLPSGSMLQEAQIQRVAAAVKQVLR